MRRTSLVSQSLALVATTSASVLVLGCGSAQGLRGSGSNNDSVKRDLLSFSEEDKKTSKEGEEGKKSDVEGAKKSDADVGATQAPDVKDGSEEASEVVSAAKDVKKEPSTYPTVKGPEGTYLGLSVTCQDGKTLSEAKVCEKPDVIYARAEDFCKNAVSKEGKPGILQYSLGAPCFEDKTPPPVTSKGLQGFQVTCADGHKGSSASCDSPDNLKAQALKICELRNSDVSVFEHGEACSYVP